MKEPKRLTEDECREVVVSYFTRKQAYEDEKAQFESDKSDFYGTMSEYFAYNNIVDGKLHIDCGVAFPPLTVTRVQNVKIKFDPDKLERALGKKLAEQVIIKSYSVVDMLGLTAYLKQCTDGVDPKIFRSFIAVSKKVDTKALEQLEALGKITSEQISGCYTLERQSPYFTVTAGKGQNDGKRE